MIDELYLSKDVKLNQYHNHRHLQFKLGEFYFLICGIELFYFMETQLKSCQKVHDL